MIPRNILTILDAIALNTLLLNVLSKTQYWKIFANTKKKPIVTLEQFIVDLYIYVYTYIYVNLY